MARPKTLITDVRHLPADTELVGPSLFAFLASIVAAGSLEGPEACIRTSLRCRCRPKRRLCPGVILLERHSGSPEIEWRCSQCELNGVLTHWQHSPWDLAATPRRESNEVVPFELPRNRVPAVLVGRWRIVEMQVWDTDAIDLMGPAFIDLAAHSAYLRFIAIEGGLDCRYGEIDGREAVEFSWLGEDEGDAACGRGWARLQADGSLVGRIFIHDGDDSHFTARRVEESPARATRGRRAR